MTTAPTHPTKKRKITGFGIALLFVLAFAIFFHETFKTVVVAGPSMKPALEDGQKVLVSSAYWLVGPIRKKDIVLVEEKHPRNPTGYIIKRIAYLPGEKVNWRFIPENWRLDSGDFIVPEGHVFVLGDNRAQSEDSRKFGPIPMSRILGKVVVGR